MRERASVSATFYINDNANFHAISFKKLSCKLACKSACFNQSTDDFELASCRGGRLDD